MFSTAKLSARLSGNVKPLMKRSAALLLPLLVVSLLAHSADMTSAVSGEGVATGSLPGVVHVSGFEMKIITLKAASGSVNVLVPSMTSTPTGIGERVSFAGRRERMGNMEVINTSGGYIYRPAAKTLQEQMNEQMALAQQMAGNADALPVRQAVTPLVVIALLLALFSGLSLMPTLFRARRFNIGLRIHPLSQPRVAQLAGGSGDTEAVVIDMRLLPHGTQVPQLLQPLFKLDNVRLDYDLSSENRTVVFPLRVDKNIDLTVSFPKAGRTIYFEKGRSLHIEFKDALCNRRFSGKVPLENALEARPNNGSQSDAPQAARA